MINEIAWNVFKQTGNINTYLEIKELENIEKNLKDNVDEAIKGKWDRFN